MFFISLFAIFLAIWKRNISKIWVVGEGSKGGVRKGWNIFAGMHLLSACSGSTRLCGRAEFDTASKLGVWGMLFSLKWRFFFSPITATTFSVGLTQMSDEPEHEAGNKELVLCSAMSVLPPIAPLVPMQAPEQASAFLLLCHPTVQSRSRRHCGVQPASCVIEVLP